MISTNTSGLHFPGQDRDEVVHFFFRQHWIRLLRPLIRMIVWSVLLGIALVFTRQISAPGQQTTRHVMLFLLCLLFLYSQFEFLNEFYRHFLYVLVVTNRKIHRIKKTLFVLDEHQSIDVTALQDVHKGQHGVIQNIFRFGTLTLEAQESVLRIHFVPDVQRKYNAILQLRGRDSRRAAEGPTHDHPPVSIGNDD